MCFPVSTKCTVATHRCLLAIKVTLTCGMPQVTSTAAERPKPVYKSTACQLGIHATAGVWSLLDTLLPPGPTSLLVRRWLRRLLLLPPPTHVALSIRTACQLLSGEQLPHTQPCSISEVTCVAKCTGLLYWFPALFLACLTYLHLTHLFALLSPVLVPVLLLCFSFFLERHLKRLCNLWSDFQGSFETLHN